MYLLSHARQESLPSMQSEAISQASSGSRHTSPGRLKQKPVGEAEGDTVGDVDGVADGSADGAGDGGVEGSGDGCMGRHGW